MLVVIVVSALSSHYFRGSFYYELGSDIMTCQRPSKELHGWSEGFLGQVYYSKQMLRQADYWMLWISSRWTVALPKDNHRSSLWERSRKEVTIPLDYSPSDHVYPIPGHLQKCRKNSHICYVVCIYCYTDTSYNIYIEYKYLILYTKVNIGYLVEIRHGIECWPVLAELLLYYYKSEINLKFYSSRTLAILL